MVGAVNVSANGQLDKAITGRVRDVQAPFIS